MLAQISNGPLPGPGTAVVGAYLPDSPGSIFFEPAAYESASSSTPTFFDPAQAGQISVQTNGQTSERKPRTPTPCVANPNPALTPPPANAKKKDLVPCPQGLNPYERFLNSTQPIPLSPRQKGYLAIHDVIDPFNLLTIGANAAFTVGIDSHSAYGPGLKGFGRNIGYSLSQDVNGEFIGTFLICSLAHEDPHYHRLPQATPMRRLYHAVSRTFVAQKDDGRPMLNIETLLTYPISAELANLYVPGVHGDGVSTVERIATGLATDPVNNIITEFLPDFARHVHIRVVFAQQILNQIASGQQL
ncbi:hypothetical protein [Granulicella tundricola]|nr:hypothetical protein [Granulicella tundricola]